VFVKSPVGVAKAAFGAGSHRVGARSQDGAKVEKSMKYHRWIEYLRARDTNERGGGRAEGSAGPRPVGRYLSIVGPSDATATA
jgi:hypothetical protein